MLLESSFDLMQLSNGGMSALHLACIVEKTEICSLIVTHLIEGGYRKFFIRKVLNQVNPQLHITPLSAALIAGNHTQAIELIQSGAKVYLKDTDRLKDLSPVFVAVYLDQRDILEIICDVHATTNILNSRNHTPIMAACHHMALNAFDFLSLQCDNLNVEDEDGLSILVQLLIANHFVEAQRLLRRGANVNYCNLNGQTALNICIESNLVDAVRFLLDEGASPHIMDLSGEDACDKARDNQSLCTLPQFNQCSLRLKRPPKMPTGVLVNFDKLPLYM